MPSVKVAHRGTKATPPRGAPTADCRADRGDGTHDPDRFPWRVRGTGLCSSEKVFLSQVAAILDSLDVRANSSSTESRPCMKFFTKRGVGPVIEDVVDH
jgi:hypothetical protein